AADAVNGAEDGDLVSVDLRRSGRHGLADGRVRERIGSIRSEKAISTIALHVHNIPYVFPDALLEEAATLEPAGMEHREDWRKIPFVTIDPADAKDHDDAIYAEPDPDPGNPGGVHLWVAIADVAFYVRPGS